MALLVQRGRRARGRRRQKRGAGRCLVKKLRYLIIEKRPAHESIRGQRGASSGRQFSPSVKWTDMFWIEVWLNRGYIYWIHLTWRLQYKEFLIGLEVDSDPHGTGRIGRRLTMGGRDTSLHLQPALVGANNVGDIAEHLEPAVRQPADPVAGSAQRRAVV